MLKAGSHVRRKRKSKRKRRSHVQRKRKQNEIRTRISICQDGGNLVLRLRVTLDQHSGNEDSGNMIKDGGGGRHLGSNVNRRGTEQVFFILRLPLG